MIITPNWTVVAIGFDGTIARTNEDYTIVGPIKENVDYIKHLAELGAVLVLWTSREGKLLEDAVVFCESQDLHFPYVNENPPFRVEKFGTNPRKLDADYYIDDKNVLPPTVHIGKNVLKNTAGGRKYAETWEEFNNRYPENPKDIDEEFMDNLFYLYEKDGFAKLYWSPYTQYDSYIGKPFIVLRRATIEEFDFECLPAWEIKFEDGITTFAFPEEITPNDRKSNGCTLE